MVALDVDHRRTHGVSHWCVLHEQARLLESVDLEASVALLKRAYALAHQDEAETKPKPFLITFAFIDSWTSGALLCR